MKMFATMTSFFFVSGVAFAANDSLDEAFSFVQSRLGNVFDAQTKSMWTANNLQSDAYMWKWREIQVVTNMATSSALTIDEQYAVDVRQLVYPVQVKGGNIRFECLRDKCFRVEVLSFSITGDIQKHRRTEFREFNIWRFNTADDANRVAKAMNDAFSILGASKRRY